MSTASRLVSTLLKFSCVQDDKHRDESRCGSLKATPRFYLGGTMVRIRYDTHIDFVSVCRRCRRRAGRNVFIVAYDAVNGDWGVTVASRYFSVGSVVPWAEAGVARWPRRPT